MSRYAGTPWGGRGVEQAREFVRITMMPGVCARCKKPVTEQDNWVVGHIRSRAAHPELTWDASNWRPEHRKCSDRTGQSAVIEKARLSALKDAGFPHPAASQKSPPLSFSPPEGSDDDNHNLIQPALDGLNLPAPKTDDYNIVRPGLEWDPEYLRQFDWLAEFADVPADASPPLFMSPVSPEAVGSLGKEIIDWAREEHGLELRWWQKLAIMRQYEHRADGSLIHTTIVESASRRSGKSVRMRISALWRLQFAHRFKEPQLVMHTGSDIPICREIQRGAWRWATEQGWEVTRANGKEAIETLYGDRWLVRSQDGVYGYDVTYGLVDEGWNVKPDTVSEGLEPATLERIQPQMHLTSTAHRRATSLMKKAIKDALSIDDPTVLLLLWGALPGSDPADPEVWRAASPYWSEDRRKLIASKYEAALAGQADPQADDPDPMAGFTAQYLNMWQLNVSREDPGEPLTDEETWAKLQITEDIEPLELAGAAIESWFGQGVSVALAFRTSTVPLVTVADYPNLAAAVEAVKAYDSRCKVRVGETLADDPNMRALGGRVVASRGRAAAVALALPRFIAENAFMHDGGEYLTEQVLNLRTKPSSDGPRIVSKTRADAIKTVVWALSLARENKKRIRRLVLPSGA